MSAYPSTIKIIRPLSRCSNTETLGPLTTLITGSTALLSRWSSTESLGSLGSLPSSSTLTLESLKERGNINICRQHFIWGTYVC